jgi:DNA-binding NtrC family response regulator
MSFSSSNQYNDSNNTHVHLQDSHHILLIVDDESDILTVVRRALEEHSFNTCCFTKPRIALEHYKTSPSNHDVVISDLQMPNVNGFEFIRKVKDINSNVKAFLMSSSFQTGDLGLLSLPKSNSSSSLNLMIDEFILKPFSVQKLVMLIWKHLEVS